MVLQLALREDTRKETDARTTETMNSKERLAAKSSELSQLSARRAELADELSGAKSQNAVEATVLDG